MRTLQTRVPAIFSVFVFILMRFRPSPQIWYVCAFSLWSTFKSIFFRTKTHRTVCVSNKNAQAWTKPHSARWLLHPQTRIYEGELLYKGKRKQLTWRDNSRSGIMTWGLVRKPGGRFAVTACSVIERRDHRLAASKNGCVELQNKFTSDKIYGIISNLVRLSFHLQVVKRKPPFVTR